MRKIFAYFTSSGGKARVPILRTVEDRFVVGDKPLCACCLGVGDAKLGAA